MQRLFFIFLVLLSVIPAFAGEAIKRIPNFFITSSEKDPSVKHSEAILEFEIANRELHQQENFTTPIQISCNGKQQTFYPDKNGKFTWKTPSGRSVFQLFAGPSYFEVYSDSVDIKGGHKTHIRVYFDHSEVEIISDKPVIYLYPVSDLEVTTTVEPAGTFTFTYPEYTNGWKGTAHPDGSITIGESTYPYLFWEAKSGLNTAEFDPTYGFIVSREQTVSFLEEKLTEMGLNNRERTDFITYWGPRLTNNPANFIQFQFNEDCNRYAELYIVPEPAQIFRVYMIWSATDPTTTVRPEPQILPAVQRNQFYAIEWGGSEIPFIPLTSEL